jgi:ribosomal protein S18 acetylase RimI-like enzyme
MKGEASIGEISIRTDFLPGDLGSVLRLHGRLYGKEYGYGLAFEAYVARGLGEFAERYDAGIDRVWVCERGGEMVGSLLLMHREDRLAQLRYFLIEPEYRGIGLGSRLLGLFMEALKRNGYRGVYLWTTDEQTAATRLYVSRGFVLTEEKDSSAFGKPLKERRYELMLPAPPA